MKYLNDFADERLRDEGCIFCGGPEETRDHAPSRVLLDRPFPEQLPVVPSCTPCNNGFSLDEQYVACLLDCVISGSTDPEMVQRDVVRNILLKHPELRQRLDAARQQEGDDRSFRIESDRVRRVVCKLARAHAAFELSTRMRQEPTRVGFVPVTQMDDAQREMFEAPQVGGLLGEVGSRAMQRACVIEARFRAVDGTEAAAPLLMQDWVDVQEGRYRYIAYDDGDQITVRIVLSEYLACEVVWEAFDDE